MNESIAQMVRGVPPFPYVRQSLEKLQGKADVLVISATPNEALEREWEEHGLDKFVAAICGQEIGTKKETLAVSQQFEPNHTLMVGDAPGDYQAAVANKALFFPINPGAEEGQLEADVRRGARSLLLRQIRGRISRQVVGRIQNLFARETAVAADRREVNAGANCKRPHARLPSHGPIRLNHLSTMPYTSAAKADKLP